MKCELSGYAGDGYDGVDVDSVLKYRFITQTHQASKARYSIVQYASEGRINGFYHARFIFGCPNQAIRNSGELLLKKKTSPEK
jgi:hypothetical protein